MRATKLDVRWSEPETGQQVSIPFRRPGILVRVGVEPSERRCPACNSLVYSRRHNRCGVCGRILPTSCLFTSDEAERVDALLRKERQRHRDWLRRAATA
jgi:hypothetical protein